MVTLNGMHGLILSLCNVMFQYLLINKHTYTLHYLSMLFSFKPPCQHDFPHLQLVTKGRVPGAALLKRGRWWEYSISFKNATMQCTMGISLLSAVHTSLPAANLHPLRTAWLLSCRHEQEGSGQSGGNIAELHRQTGPCISANQARLCNSALDTVTVSKRTYPQSNISLIFPERR